MRKGLLLVPIFLLWSTVAFAQQEKGDVEIQIAGSYITSVGSDFDFSQGTIQAKLGRYISDRLEMGVSPTVTITTSQGAFGDTDTDVTVGGGAFFQFSMLAGDAMSVPYFGAQYFKRDLSDEDDNGSAGINGGIKFFVTEKAALDFSGNYLFDLNENSDGGFLLFAAGISFLF